MQACDMQAHRGIENSLSRRAGSQCIDPNNQREKSHYINLLILYATNREIGRTVASAKCEDIGGAEAGVKRSGAADRTAPIVAGVTGNDERNSAFVVARRRQFEWRWPSAIIIVSNSPT